MDTCTNCGASLRPGAKFCTTCGTQLNGVSTTSNAGWGAPRPQPQDSSQETRVIEAVQPEEVASIREESQTTTDSWNSAYGSSSNDPASRFRTALDSEVQPVDDEPKATSDEAESGWGSPSFVPPKQSNWSYSAGAEEKETEEADSATSSWGATASWGSSETPAEATVKEVDTAGFSDDGDDEVDALSGDENIEVSGASTPLLAPDDARTKAIALADELRRTIRMMSAGGESDSGAAVAALTDASLKVGDFSDVRGVLADVKNDPRDIQALSNLAGKVERIELLLDDHASLADAIERAITKLNG